jgi:hypothetical protein
MQNRQYTVSGDVINITSSKILLLGFWCIPSETKLKMPLLYDSGIAPYLLESGVASLFFQTKKTNIQNPHNIHVN